MVTRQYFLCSKMAFWIGNWENSHYFQYSSLGGSHNIRYPLYKLDSGVGSMAGIVTPLNPICLSAKEKFRESIRVTCVIKSHTKIGNFSTGHISHSRVWPRPAGGARFTQPFTTICFALQSTYSTFTLSRQVSANKGVRCACVFHAFFTFNMM